MICSQFHNLGVQGPHIRPLGSGTMLRQASLRPAELTQLWQMSLWIRRTREAVALMLPLPPSCRKTHPHTDDLQICSRGSPFVQGSSLGHQQAKKDPSGRISHKSAGRKSGMQQYNSSSKQSSAEKDRKEKPEKWAATFVAYLEEEKEVEQALIEGTALMGRHHWLWALVLDKLSEQQKWGLALQVLKCMQRQPWFTPHPRWHTKVILIMAKAGRPDEAEELFRAMDSVPNTQAYNALMKAFARAGLEQKAANLLDEMKGSQMGQPDHRTYHILLEARAKAGDVRGAESFFQTLQNEGQAPDLLIYNTMIMAYVKSGSWEKMEDIFKQMIASGLIPSPSILNILVKGFLAAGQPEKFWEILQAARSSGLLLSLENYTSLICAFAKAGNVTAAERIFLEMQEHGCQPDVVAHNALVAAFAHAGAISKMDDAVHRMKSLGCEPNLVTYTSCMKGYLKAGQVESALQTLQASQLRGFQPDLHMYGTALAAADTMGMARAAEQLIEEVSTGNGTLNEAVYGAAYEATRRAATRQYKSGLREKMPVSQEATWPSLEIIEAALAGQCNNIQRTEMEMVMDRLTASGFAPSRALYNLLLRCFLDAKRVDWVLAVLSAMGAHGHSPNLMTYNMLISRLGKEGHVEAAERLMVRMQADSWHPDVYTYNSMLAAYSRAGLTSKMEALFTGMMQGGCKPDLVSFNTVINAYAKMDRWQGLAKMEQARSMCRQAGFLPDKYTEAALEKGLVAAKKKAKKWRSNERRRARLRAAEVREAADAGEDLEARGN